MRIKPFFIRHRIRGFTLIEMMTTIAVLVIIMGLMISLARRVRSHSADRVTKSLLRSLDAVMRQYESKYGQLPDVPLLLPNVSGPMLDAKLPDKSVIAENALLNNRELMRALTGGISMPTWGIDTSYFMPKAGTQDTKDLGILRDAWGTPIVFMRQLHPSIGTAPENKFFFVSAGPDGDFLTRDDNLYSYETTGATGFTPAAPK